MRDQMNSEQRNRDVSNSPRDIIYTLDLAGNFTFINRAGEMVCGYSCEEARRMNITEVVAPGFAAYFGEQIKRHVRERFGAVYEIDLITRMGAGWRSRSVRKLSGAMVSRSRFRELRCFRLSGTDVYLR